jgi:hypothetical protein
MRGTIPPLPQNAFMAWYLTKHRDNFKFLPKLFTVTSFWINAGFIFQRALYVRNVDKRRS